MTSDSNEEAAKGATNGVAVNTFEFRNLNFTVKDRKNDCDKHIIKDITASVQGGNMLAMMGPSGAGKTSLIKALSLGAFGGKTTGSVTLNGVPMTDMIFKKNCFLVEQNDVLCPYLTCKETLLYAAELYGLEETKESEEKLVDGIITKMGLDNCKDTKATSMSGGQRRRLSVGIALVKRAVVVFLDEPTSGLDAASCSAVMREISRVAKEEKLIVVCTIHQPSYKVYELFDQVMILSKGRVAYIGDTDKALNYFETIGYPMEEPENPADFLLDCVNADFTSSEEVDKILDAWEKKPEENEKLLPGIQGIEGKKGGVSLKYEATSVMCLLWRQSTIIARDPILYAGRIVTFIFVHLFFSFVYWDARSSDQLQALNKCWLYGWYMGVPGMMGVVAVYGLNEEFKAIRNEVKNGMIEICSYAVVKTILVIPIMFITSVCSLGLSAYAIHDYPRESFGVVTIVWAVTILTFECMAEAMSVSFDNPILGMLGFVSLWFCSFLFAGILIDEDSMIWPFRLFLYVMPLGYSWQVAIYASFKDFAWSPCSLPGLEPGDEGYHPVCEPTTNGLDILDATGEVYPIFSSDVNVGQKMGILIAIAFVWKIVYLFLLLKRGRNVSVVQPL